MQKKIIISGILIFLLGLGGGFLVDQSWDRSQKDSEGGQVRQNGGYTYINPLLECEVAEGSIDARKESFQDDLQAFVDGLKKNHELSDAAVYFRDLNNGPTFGINEKGEFFPASLLKVPVMMAYYHMADDEPGLLEKEIFYEKPQILDFTPTIIPREELVPGQSYQVGELIRRMIVYSDNQSLLLLSSRLPLSSLQDLFSMLGVGEDVLTNPDAKLTVKEYAGFFRILFNSSYLSRESSEKALALLAMTDYNDALPAGVPQEVKVSHKFGEAGTMDAERQLHDCGIVYFPSHPYLACIMTRGQDEEVLRRSIKEISRFIYQKVDEQY